MHDNLEDIAKFVGGTMSFTFDNVAYTGQIHSINYAPVGPGGINVTLVSLQPVTEGHPVPDIPLDFTFSFFGAELTHNAREIVINHVIVAPDHFGNIVSLRMPDRSLR